LAAQGALVKVLAAQGALVKVLAQVPSISRLGLRRMSLIKKNTANEIDPNYVQRSFQIHNLVEWKLLYACKFCHGGLSLYL
ncbi:hypothetical protein, partial [Paenibacillus whitsoniae]|uniref:hypothetical protein n=1 Tax=Paenibacillus whitsoniae TaxID=2496558 RepID=UPI0019D00C3E